MLYGCFSKPCLHYLEILGVFFFCLLEFSVERIHKTPKNKQAYVSSVKSFFKNFEFHSYQIKKINVGRLQKIRFEIFFEKGDFFFMQ